MIGVTALAILTAPLIAPPIPWASGFAPDGSWAYVADMNGDGYADLIRVQPNGDSFIDVSLNCESMKAGRPDRALSNWGKDCMAAAVGVLGTGKQSAVVGAFGGNQLRLATSDEGGKFTDKPDWAKLPAKIAHPKLAVLGGNLFVWDVKSGRGYRIDGTSKATADFRAPAGTISIQEAKSSQWIFEFQDGTVKRGSVASSSPELIGKVLTGQNAVVAGDSVFVDTVSKNDGTVLVRPTSSLVAAPSIWCAGDIDKDGDVDLFQFRFGHEQHTANDVMVYRTVSDSEIDSDHDGLTNVEEAKLGTDPYNPDTDGDGLLDGWEVKGIRGLDLAGMSCDPRKVDLVCLISRFEDVDEKFAKDTFDKIKGYYKSLPVKNSDGSTGWNLHPVFLDKVSGGDMKNSWWANRDKFLPSKWKGIVHWMQIGRGGGGQADQLGDGGGCGGGGMALYATFIHEFGHQLGLSHNGFFNSDGCPVFPSLMNYPYSYTLNGDIKNIGYSDGRLANVLIKESDLDEELPLPYEKVKFLENAPYRFHLKANGKTTLIDWNWNGVFGEHHVKADINYAYSTTAGRRDNVDKTECAPFIVSHKGHAYVLFTRDTRTPNPKIDPTNGPDKPGALYIKRLKKPFEWEKEQTIDYWGVIGDPVAASFGGKIVVAYQTKDGIVVREVSDTGSGIDVSTSSFASSDSKLVPTIGEYDHKLWLFLWNPATQTVTYQVIKGGSGPTLTLPDKSTVPVGPAVDTIHHQLILGMAQDQDDKRLSRWQIRKYILRNDAFVSAGMEWIEGEKGSVRGRSRPTVLFDADKRHGKDGKIYYFTLGDHGKESPWACGYVAETISDKKISGGHVQGGWLVKRYYDEWSNSRSTVGAAFFGGDILYAYRWIDGGQGATDNLIHLGYHGTGIESAEMGDFDDLGYMQKFGIQHCILYLNKN